MKLYLFILIIFPGLLACNENRKTSVFDSNNSRDTTKLVVSWNTSTYTITSTDVWLNNNNLILEVSSENHEHFNFEIQNKANQWMISGISGIAIPDCLFIASQFRVLSQVINLNKNQFNSGDQLEGSINLILLGKKAMIREALVPFVDKRNWDTIRMQGNLSSQID